MDNESNHEQPALVPAEWEPWGDPTETVLGPAPQLTCRERLQGARDTLRWDLEPIFVHPWL